MSEIHDSQLYQAATNALASDASAENTYSKMITAATAYVSAKDFKTELIHIEQVIKDEYGMTIMPSPWRSAKSVILGAMKLNIKLIDDNFTNKGKSALQAEIKSMKEEITVVAPVDKAWVLVTKLGNMFHELTNEEKLAIQKYAATLS